MNKYGRFGIQCRGKTWLEPLVIIVYFGCAVAVAANEQSKSENHASQAAAPVSVPGAASAARGVETGAAEASRSSEPSSKTTVVPGIKAEVSSDSGPEAKSIGEDTPPSVNQADTSSTIRTAKPENSVAEENVDFGPYMDQVQRTIRANWYPPFELQSKKLVIAFKIHSDGTTSNLKVVKSGGLLEDSAGLDAIRRGAPFHLLPVGAPESVDISFTFDYHMFSAGDIPAVEKSIARLESTAGDHRVKIQSSVKSLADSYAVSAQDEKAKQAFTKALNLANALYGKNSQESLDVVASEVRLLYSLRKNWKVALEVLRKTAAGMPAGTSVEARARLQSLEAEFVEEPQKHWEAAIHLLTEASQKVKSLKRSNLFSRYTRMLASCFIRADRPDKAVATLNAAVNELLARPSVEVAETLSLAHFLCEVETMAQHDYSGAIVSAEMVYAAFKAKYGEFSRSTVDALDLCVYAANQGTNVDLKKKYEDKRKHDLAQFRIAGWEKVLQSNKSADNVLGYAMCLEDLNKKQALEQYKKGVDQFPTDQRFKQHLDALLTGVSARTEKPSTAVTKSSPGGAPPSSGKAHPTSVARLNNEGVRALNERKFAVAIEKLRAALAIDPSYGFALDNLVIAYNNFGISLQENPAVAIVQFRRASYLKPEDPGTRNNLEVTIEKLGLNARSFGDRIRMAESALAANDPIGGIVEFNEALRLRPDASIEERIKKIALPDGWPKPRNPKAELVERWENQCKLTPSSVDAHMGLSSALVGVGDLNRAAGELKKALALDPQNQPAKAAMESLENQIRKADTVSGGDGAAASPKQ